MDPSCTVYLLLNQLNILLDILINFIRAFMCLFGVVNLSQIGLDFPPKLNWQE